MHYLTFFYMFVDKFTATLHKRVFQLTQTTKKSKPYILGGRLPDNKVIKEVNNELKQKNIERKVHKCLISRSS